MSAPAAARVSSVSAPAARMPSGIPFIIGNEAAERFSFYGMRSILFVYMTTLYLGFQQPENVAPELAVSAKTQATQVTHTFMAGVYAFPMLGAILADRLWGKYPVILWVSLIYCAGHGLLAVAGHSEWGMYAGLALIALGSGGIKPCVSANVGDQFTSANAHLVNRVYQIFYFSVNFGSFFSTLLIPWVYAHPKLGAEWAFGIPGLLMALATLIFWLGRNRFVRVPPTPGGWLGALDSLAAALLFVPFAMVAFLPHGAEAAESSGWLNWPTSVRIVVSFVAIGAWWSLFSYRQRRAPDGGFIAVLLHALTHQRERQPGRGFFSVAEARYGVEAAAGPPAVLRIMLVFSMVSVFWALFDQHSSTWIQQAGAMNLELHLPAWLRAGGEPLVLKASQIPALNPLFVMLVIPALQLGVFGPLERRGVVIKPLARMTVGMFLTSLSFVAVALIEWWIAAVARDGGLVHVGWQIIPYLILTTSEVLVSVTGLEFAYTQAPRSMKSTILGFWLLCVTVGNLLVAFLAPLQQRYSLAEFFWLFAGLMAAAAGLFAVLAHFYRGTTYLQEAATE